MTETKSARLRELENELKKLDDELFKFDSMNENSDYYRWNGRDVHFRKQAEFFWTEEIREISKYFDSVEFATLMDEKLEHFFRSYLVEEKRRGKHDLSDLLTRFVENWSNSNEGNALTRAPDTRVEKRKEVLAEHFRSLVNSYVMSESRGEDTVRLRDVTLNLIGSLEKK